MRAQRTTTVGERRQSFAGGGARSRKGLRCSHAEHRLPNAVKPHCEAREKRSRMSSPCLSAHMPRHSHSMVEVGRGVKVMKVCGQLIPGRDPGVALLALPEYLAWELDDACAA